MSPCLSNAQSASSYKSNPDTFLDWVSESAATSLCKGHYVPSEIGPIDLSAFSSDPIALSADETELTFGGRSTLRGAVTVKQGNRSLHADEVLIQRSPSTDDLESIFANGHIHLFAPGINVWGERAQYYHLEQHLHLEHASYRLYQRHARGVAQQIDIYPESMVLKGANYTTCSPHDTTWLLSAKKIALDPATGRATAKHVHLDLYDVPVFYFPYINYPIDNKRHSGFLFPSYGTSSNSGTEILVPYYWNIAPNYDLLLAGRWLSERGLEAHSKFQYLTPRSQGVLQLYMLPDDRKYGTFSEQNLLSPPPEVSIEDPRIQGLHGSNNRYAINYRHTTDWNQKWQLNIVFDRVSDDNYFVDLGNDIQTASTIQLPQKANLTYYGQHWTHLFNIEEYQVLEPLSKPLNEEIYKRQPQWAFQAFYPHQWLNFTFGLLGETVNFTHRPDLITDLPVTTGQRQNLRPSISFPMQESWYFLNPRIQWDWLYYTLHLDAQDQALNKPASPMRTIPLYDIDSGLIFERDARFKQIAFTQTFEPRLYYLYVPYRDQHLYPDFDTGIMNFSYASLFRDNRFSGRDRIADANQLSVSFTTRFLPPQGGQEWLRASIGQVFYFQKRHVYLCEEVGVDSFCFQLEDPSPSSDHSNIVAEAEFHPSSIWTGGFFWEWDALNQDTEQAGFNIQYHPAIQKIINMNYYWLRHDIGQIDDNGTIGSLNQADISVFWPLTLRWQLLSRLQYDFNYDQIVEVLGGLEYNGCCFALQLVGSCYRQSTESYVPDFAHGIFAQIVFKGMSSVGAGSPDSTLKQKIPGYTPLRHRHTALTSKNTLTKARNAGF